MMTKDQYNKIVKDLGSRLSAVLSEYQDLLELVEQSEDMTEGEKQAAFDSEEQGVISIYFEI